MTRVSMRCWIDTTGALRPPASHGQQGIARAQQGHNKASHRVVFGGDGFVEVVGFHVVPARDLVVVEPERPCGSKRRRGFTTRGGQGGAVGRTREMGGKEVRDRGRGRKTARVGKAAARLPPHKIRPHVSATSTRSSTGACPRCTRRWCRPCAFAWSGPGAPRVAP